MGEQSKEVRILSAFSKEENDVYAQIMRHGFATSSYISEYTKMKEKDIIKIIAKFLEKKFIEKVPGIIPRYIAKRPYDGLINILENFDNQVVKIKKELKGFDYQRKIQIIQVTDLLKISLKNIIQHIEHEVVGDQKKFKKEFETNYTAWMKNIEKLKQEIPDQFKISLKETIEGKMTDLDEIEEVFKEKTEEFLATYKKDISKSIDRILDKISELQKYTLKQVATSKKRIESLIIEAQKKTSESISELIDYSNSKLDETSKNLQILKEKSKILLDSTYKSMIDLYNSNKAASIKNWGDSTSKLMVNVENLIKNIGEHFNKTQTKLKSDLENDFKLKKVNQVKSISIFAEELNKVKENLGKKLQSALNLIETNKTDSLSKNNNLLNDHNNSLKTNLSESFDKQLSLANGYTQKINSNFQEISKSMMNSLKNLQTPEVNEFVKKFKNLSSEFDKNLKKETKNLDEQNKSIKTSFNENVDKYTSEIKEKFETNINELSGKLKNEVQEIAKESEMSDSKKSEALTHGFDDSNKNFQTSVSDVINNTESVLKGSLETITKLFSEITSEHIPGVTSQIEKIYSDLMGELDKIKGGISELQNGSYFKLESDSTPFSNAINKLKDTFMDEFAESSRKVLDVIDATTKSWNLVCDDLGPETNGCLDVMQSNSDDIIYSLLVHIAEIKEHIHNNYASTLTDIGLNTEDGLVDIAGHLNESLRNMQFLFSNSSKNLIESTSLSMENMLDEAITKLLEAKGTIDGSTVEIFESIILLVDEINKNTKTPLNILKSTWAYFTDSTLLPIENVWLIQGREPSFFYIEEVIGRTQESLVLFMPYLESIDEKTLLQMKNKTASVQIFTNCVIADENLLKKITKQGSEIFNSPNKDFVFVLRDNKEVLFLPLPASLTQEDTHEFVSIVSILPSFVRKMSDFVKFLSADAEKF
jgi:hypothetical protein